jgi:putative ABC transport system permease protein
MRAFADTLFSALRVLGAHKLRSALTLLGIVIGVVAVVGMSAVMAGLDSAMHKQMEQLASNVFQVQKWPAGPSFGGRNWAKIEKRKNFTLGEVEYLSQHCQSCLRVAGEAWNMAQKVSAGDKIKQNVQVVGGTESFFDNNAYALGSGRFYTDGEIAAGAEVVVLGSDVVDVLFPGRNPIGEEVRIANRQFRVIGTIERRGSSFEGSIDNIASIPITRWMQLFGTQQSLNVTVMVRNPDKVGAAQDEVVSLIRKIRHTPPEEENDFDMFTNRSMQEQFNNIMGMFTTVTLVVTGISLIIAGIGVMNIMFVAVTERTSEIGVRRALGARRRRILLQFIMEAAMLTTLGGLLGIALAFFAAYLIRVLSGVPTEVQTWAVAIGVMVAAGTGLVFGIYPAWRASRLDPVEAMRHE